MTRWEIIADNLSKAGWNCGCVSSVHSRGRTIWIVDAHSNGRKRFVVAADGKADDVFGIAKNGLYPRLTDGFKVPRGILLKE